MSIPSFAIRIYCLSFFILTACSSPLNQKEFVSWIQDPDNGFRIIRNVDGVSFDVQYKPDQYLDLERSEINKAGSNSLDERPLKHFTLKIGLNGQGDIVRRKSNHSDVQQDLYYYSFLFQDDIYLEKAGTRIACGLYHFEKSIDSNNNRIFHLVFEDSVLDREDEFVLVVDSDRLSSLPLRFRFTNHKLPLVARL
jgi:hypothetical protein